MNLPGLKSNTYETSPEKSLPLLLAELKRRFGQIEIDLERAGPQRNRRFVEALIDRWPNQVDLSFRTAFYQRTRGHALFAVEMIREMQASGDLFLDKNGKWAAAENLDWGRLPARIEAVIAQRLYRIDAELRQLMDAASVEGEVFSAQVLSGVLKRTNKPSTTSSPGWRQNIISYGNWPKSNWPGRNTYAISLTTYFFRNICTKT